ncbi:MAG: helix-turn-helix transcriptional regulator [Clostridia bacterium]|nr:helix-turn-helix transcriptional regulator [Clostridia bacterium]
MKEKILAVQAMQDYIMDHMTETISLADLAKTAHFSPWYAHRLFKELTGISPAEYIRKLRLSEAAKRLKNEKSRVTDLAMTLDFESLDGFTRAFVREFGMTPSEYRLLPTPITLFIPYGVKFRELFKEKVKMEKVRNVFIQVIRKPARKSIIKRGVNAKEYWDYCNEVGCDVWGTLMSMDSLCGEPVCLWLPEKYIKPNTSQYVQGVEVNMDFAGNIPDGFDVIALPACEYLMFQGEPFREEDYCEAITAVQNAMDRYDPSVIGYEWDHENPRIQLEPRGERGYIELRAIKLK